MVEGEPPTEDQVAEMRRRICDYVEENGKAVFDNRDVQKFLTNDFLVHRYFMHVHDVSGDQTENAISMVINSFKWRLETGITDITADDVKESMKAKGVLYMHNRDRDGKRLLVMDVKRHAKGEEKMDDMKKFFLYFVERVEREENGDKLTLVFDCAGAGLKNMDMEFIRYIISVFKDNTPWNLNYILVFEMPWVMSAAWKVIKTWLPAAAVRKIKFLSKSNIDEFVDEDQRLEAWGGTDDWEYEFEPEGAPTAPASVPRLKMAAAVNDTTYASPIPVENHNAAANHVGSGDDDSGPAGEKKVHFQQTQLSASPPAYDDTSTAAAASSSGPMSRSASLNLPDSQSAALLSLSPSEEVVFNQTPQGDLLAKIKVTNVSSGPVAFKVKTTSPEKYRVRPSMSSLAASGSATIEIQVQASAIGFAATLVRDKFLVTAVTVEQDNLTHARVAEIMKNAKPEAQYRLKCVIAASDAPFGAAAVGMGNGIQDKGQQAKQLETLTKKVTTLVRNNEELVSEVAFMKKLAVAILSLLLLTFLMLLWRTSHLALTCNCEGEAAGAEEIVVVPRTDL